jgi:TRAP-type mannitol/chloroaromatic compound transport system permease small subunit
MEILKRFAAGVDRLNGWMGMAIRWLVLIMVLVGAYNAIARYVTRFTGVGISANALFETQWYIFSIIFLLGAAYGLEKDVHVRVDVLYAGLTNKGRAWIDLVGTVIFLIPFSLLMLWVSYPVVRNSFLIRETSMDPGGLPRYPIKALLLVSFGLLVLQALSQLIKQVVILRGPNPPPGVAEQGHAPEGPAGVTL